MLGLAYPATAMGLQDAPSNREAGASRPPLPPEAGQAEGPVGTSGAGPARYDRVGYARMAQGVGATDTALTAGAGTGVTTHATLAPGSAVEITSLDTGRTIVTRVAERSTLPAGVEIILSPEAARMLALSQEGTSAVRVRGVTPQGSLAGGGSAAQLDAPPALLAALRRQLPAAQARPATVPPVSRSEPIAARALPVAAAAPPPSPNGRSYAVQVAALSNQARAEAIAKQLGGTAQRGGALFRIRLGPFSSRIDAERARDAAVRRGYGDAAIIVQP
ncbi:SPOR domain-containing protein [Sphingomonas sp.]|jgi:rare lipoprotein A|uniref:SPOR domain-containing protein n=1 Tax=Sphingomonas sp. TaxID=28214 RepID=UPI00261A2B63|nr:SPOR domain-containing protein [Sphingomonas sp.]MDF2603471.1 hypothetical protein [Sphingomonas sp.]